MVSAMQRCLYSPDADGGGAAATNADAGKTPEGGDTPAPKPDKYAGLSAAERAEVEAMDADFDGMTLEQKRSWRDLAHFGLQVAQERRKGAAPKPEDKAAAEEEDELTTLRKRLDKFESEREAEKRDADRTEKRRKFESDLDAAIERHPGLKNRPKLKATVRRAVIGAAVQAGSVGDVAKMVAEEADEAIADFKSESEFYAKNKQADRERAGEGRGGRTPPVAEVERKATDLKDGTTKRRALERLEKAGV